MNTWVQYVLLVVVLACAGMYLFQAGQPDAVMPTAEEIAAGIVIPAVESGQIVNLTSDVADIQATLDEDDDFEDSCKDLATEEWSDNDNKEIYKAIDALVADIDEKEDIDRVVVKDSDVTGTDIDEGDCVVTQDVKVYYEDEDGDDVKEYLTITTDIEDLDVEDQTIILTV